MKLPIKSCTQIIILCLFSFIGSYAIADHSDASVLTRAEIAKPLVQAKYGLNFVPDEADGGSFTDVGVNDFNAKWIEKLADDGITLGCDDNNNYCPNMVVTKEQLALLLIKTSFGVPDTAIGDKFDDINSGSFGADHIEALYNNLISTGCDDNNFCPKEAINFATFETMYAKTLSITRYQIQLDFSLSSQISASQQLAFVNAARYWENIITGDLSNVNLSQNVATCSGGQSVPVLNIDDLLIIVNVSPIDGLFGVVGTAGPCRFRPNLLPSVGNMEFDSADIASLESRGILDAVLRHEMGHVLGIGTLWPIGGLLQNALPNGQPNLNLPQPEFIGPNAVAEYRDLGVSNANSVPVENGFTNGVLNGAGLGSVNGHWAQTALGTQELMTFRIGSTNPPISRVTIGSLQDLGYTVDYSQADDFSLP